MTDRKEKVVSTKEGYDQWSEFYDNDYIPLAVLEEPVVDKALGNIKGKSILDLGCGTGRQSIRLASQGAVVTAVDQSEGMLAKARAKKSANIQWMVADLHENLPLADHSFDFVVSFLVIEHIEDLEKFFRECRRLCKKDGTLFFSTLHPAMLLKGVQARFTDEATGEKIYPKGFRYQTCDFVNAATRAGLVLAEMGEYALSERHAAQTKKVERYLHWPMLLTLKSWPNPP